MPKYLGYNIFYIQYTRVILFINMYYFSCLKYKYKYIFEFFEKGSTGRYNTNVNELRIYNINEI